MLPLRALLDRHPTILLIDSASARVQLGLFRAGHSSVWESATEEAGTAIFSCADKLLTRAGTSAAGSALRLSAVDAFIFCDGPGSVLGIRTAAVALRTWDVLRRHETYAYSSLALTAQSLALGENLRDFSVIADARRDTWHRVAVDADGAVSPLQRVPTCDLSGTTVMPENFRHWSALPAAVRRVPYDLASQLPALENVPLFLAAPQPDAFLHEEPAYQTWTAKIHRAPV